MTKETMAKTCMIIWPSRGWIQGQNFGRIQIVVRRAAEVNESQTIVKELQQIETEMSSLLNLIDLDLSTFPAASNSDISSNSQSNAPRNAFQTSFGSRVQAVRQESCYNASAAARNLSPQISASSFDSARRVQKMPKSLLSKPSAGYCASTVFCRGWMSQQTNWASERTRARPGAS